MRPGQSCSAGDTTGFASLLGAAQAGAGWAIGQLYRQHNGGLLRYLDGRVPGAGEDLAQEVWMAVAQGLRGFAGTEEQFRSWLFTIAYRRVVQSWRDRARRKTTAVSAEDMSRLTVAVDLGEQHSAREAIDELTGGLTAEQSDVVLLRVVAGLSVAEVAAATGKTPGSVRVLQHRAVRRMAEVARQRAVVP